MNILHVFRSPVGGLFRHVYDLAEAQAKLGHNVGIICDSSTGGDAANTKLHYLESLCSLGVKRMPIGRTVGFSDLAAIRQITVHCKGQKIDIVHGHGAKGGTFGRVLAKTLSAKAIYTPHGGSMHYSLSDPTGMVYLTLERYLKRLTDGIIFDSKTSAEVYKQKVGSLAAGSYKIVHNGLHEQEFKPLVRQKHNNHFVFIGELRKLKGIDVLLEAFKQIQPSPAKLSIYGDGPDKDYFHSRTKELGLDRQVTFYPPIFPATQAFINAQCVIVPSLAESFPYIVLETVAAKVPLLTTHVGGIPEIFGPLASHLLKPGDTNALASALLQTMQNPLAAEQLADSLHAYVATHFRFTTMVENILDYYWELLQAPLEIQLKRRAAI